MTEAWTVVTASDKKRVMRKRGLRKRTETHQVHGAFLSDYEVMKQSLQECIDYISRTNVWEIATSALQGNEVGDLVCYGIGNFSRTSTTYYAASLWQLALAACLSRHLEAPLVFFDPCTTDFERNFLEMHMHCSVLTVNEQGDRPCRANSIFFMPHCPVSLYENVVRSNCWNRDASVRIVGNSLEKLCDHKSVECLCMRTLLTWLQETELKTSDSDCDKAPGNFDGAFNDTFISIYEWSKEWPDRPHSKAHTITEDQELL